MRGQEQESSQCDKEDTYREEHKPVEVAAIKCPLFCEEVGCKSFGWEIAFHGTCTKSPNDPKLSDGGGWRGPCMAGGKAAVEAGAVRSAGIL